MKDPNYYAERLHRKYRSIPIERLIPMHRTMSTAFTVVSLVEEVDFADLTFTVFAICASEKDYEFLVRPFEHQLELAKVKPDEFITKLHRFYMDFADDVKRNCYYTTFYEILAFVADQVYETPVISQGTVQFHVYSAFMNLLFQAGDYLHPDRSNVNEFIAGIRTDGTTLMTRIEPIPNLDVAMCEFERQLLFNEFRGDPMQHLKKCYEKYGYDIGGEDDLGDLNMQLQIYDNNIAMMIPWLNEYTYDLLPERLVDVVSKQRELRSTWEVDKERFRKRRRTLPANGVKIRIKGNPLIRELYMKELYHSDAIFLLCRVRMRIGDLMVRFNTLTGKFFTSFLSAIEDYAVDLHYFLEKAVLWAYAKQVLDDIGDWSEYFDGEIIERQSIGGKLRVVYGRSEGELEDRTVNGYVRRLPMGQKASDEAKARAELLGFELDEGETYVQSFIRSTWVVKSK